MSSYHWKSSDFKWWVGWFQSTHRIEIRFWRSMISISADFPACYLSHLLTVGALLSRLIPATSSLLNGRCSVFTSCLLLPLHPHLLLKEVTWSSDSLLLGSLTYGHLNIISLLLLAGLPHWCWTVWLRNISHCSAFREDEIKLYVTTIQLIWSHIN